MANKRAKKTKAERATQEQQIQHTIAALESKTVASIRQAADIFDVPRTTLQDRFSRKRRPVTTAHSAEQRLTPEEEDTVVKAVYQLDAWGWPITHEAIRNLATQLLLAKGDIVPLGTN
jgi:ABC-type methionine transport system ATPase subunit